MTDKLLVGVDGSQAGDRALDAALSLAMDAEIVLGYVIPWSPFSFSTPEENAVRHRRREEELDMARERILAPRLERVTAAGLRAEAIARHGHAAKTLAALAKETGARMVVVGRLGDTPVRTRIFGGTAVALVQLAPCPVLVVP